MASKENMKTTQELQLGLSSGVFHDSTLANHDLQADFLLLSRPSSTDGAQQHRERYQVVATSRQGKRGRVEGLDPHGFCSGFGNS